MLDHWRVILNPLVASIVMQLTAVVSTPKKHRSRPDGKRCPIATILGTVYN